MKNTKLFCLIAGEKAITEISETMMQLIHDVEIGNKDITSEYDKIIRRIDSYYQKGEDAPQKLYDRKEELEYVMNYIGV